MILDTIQGNLSAIIRDLSNIERTVSGNSQVIKSIEQVHFNHKLKFMVSNFFKKYWLNNFELSVSSDSILEHFKTKENGRVSFSWPTLVKYINFRR